MRNPRTTSLWLGVLITIAGAGLAARAAERGPAASEPATSSETYADWKNQPVERFSDAEANFKKVKQMLLERYFDSKLTEEQLYQAATDGMLRSLNGSSPTAYNKLLTPTEMQEMQVDLKGEVVGIGIEIKNGGDSGFPSVIGFTPASPAEKSGVKLGDQLVSIDGKLTKGLQFRDVVYAIRGKTGETVRLKLLRGDSVLTKDVGREALAWNPVSSAMLGSHVGLIAISFFNVKTPVLLGDAIKKLRADGMTSLIVDLRGNSGGMFDAAVESAGLLLPKDSVITRVATRDGGENSIKASKDPLVQGIPVAVMVNGDTASSAELFAASLSENLGAKVIGTRTHGKWSVQTVEDLPNHFAVKFTVEQFKSPHGHAYPDVGIEPDVPVASAESFHGETPKARAGSESVAGRLKSDPPLRAAFGLVGPGTETSNN